jgi:DNA polymerase
MGWDERQRRMLGAMGIEWWAPERGGGEAVDAQAEQPASRVDAAVLPVEFAPTAAPQDLRDASIATMDWPALRETVAGCTACGLCATRKQTVFGVGHPRAHWMLVGEAPGEQEDREGEPFVGRAGQLLDRMLRAVDLQRASPAEGEAEADPARQVFIANVLKCRPPHNRNPLPEEVRCCEPYLRRQVALVQPRIVLALGRFAVQALLGSDEPIGRLRGRVHQYEGRPLVVSYHPAYLLRNPADKARAWDDLCLAREVELGFPH